MIITQLLNWDFERNLYIFSKDIPKYYDIGNWKIITIYILKFLNIFLTILICKKQNFYLINSNSINRLL
jgi:hypothetical protein